jgi:hypothetical protein
MATWTTLRRSNKKERLGTKTQGSPFRKWDRFSWFSFCTVLKKKDSLGIHLLRDMPLSKSTSPENMIADLEAMLIKSMALQNINHMNFVTAKEWIQIKRNELEKYEKRLI